MSFILPEVPSFGAQLGRGLGAGLGAGISQTAEKLVAGLQDRAQQKRLNEYFGKLKEEHPGEKNYELMASVAASPLPMEQKAAFLRAATNFGDLYRAQQQERLQLDSVLRRYNSLIKETDLSLDKTRHGSPERKQLQDRRKHLTEQRDQLLKLDSITPIDLEKAEKTLMQPEAEEGEEDEFVEEFRPRVKFDSKNPKHKAVRDKVMNQVGGDREKAGKILSKAFRL